MNMTEVVKPFCAVAKYISGGVVKPTEEFGRRGEGAHEGTPRFSTSDSQAPESTNQGVQGSTLLEAQVAYICTRHSPSVTGDHTTVSPVADIS